MLRSTADIVEVDSVELEAKKLSFTIERQTKVKGTGQATDIFREKNCNMIFRKWGVKGCLEFFRKFIRFGSLTRL